MTETELDQNTSVPQAEAIDAGFKAGSPVNLRRRNLALSLFIASTVLPHLLFVADFSGLIPTNAAFWAWLILLLPAAAIAAWRQVWPLIVVFFLANVFVLYSHYFFESVRIISDGLWQMDLFDWAGIMKLTLTGGCDGGGLDNYEVCSLAVFMSDAFVYYFQALRLAVIPAILLSLGLWLADGRSKLTSLKPTMIRAFFQPLSAGKLVYAGLCLITALLVMSPYYLIFWE